MGIIDNAPEDIEPSDKEIDKEIEKYLGEPINSDKTVIHLYKKHGKKAYTKSSRKGRYERGTKRTP